MSEGRWREGPEAESRNCGEDVRVELRHVGGAAEEELFCEVVGAALTEELERLAKLPRRSRSAKRRSVGTKRRSAGYGP